MNYNEKIIGFYGFIDVDKNGNAIRKYCAVGKNKETGKISYYFTHTKEEAAKYLSRYCRDNKYNKSNKNRIFTDNLDKANINCKTLSDVYNRIQKANSTEKLNGTEFLDTYERKYKDKGKKNSDENKDSVFSRIISYFSKHKKARNITIAVASVATLIASGATLKLVNGPDNVVDNKTTMDDNVDKNEVDNTDKSKDDEKEKSEEAKDEKEKSEEIKDEVDTVTTVASTNSSTNSYNEQSNYSSSTTSTHNSTSSNVTKEPGSVNENVPEYQEPISIDNSNNNSDNTNNDSSTDIYEDVTEEETPVIEEENTSDNVEEDYSKEIEVPAVTDDEATDVKDEPEENESLEDLNKEDVQLKDELVGKEDAINDDVSYDLVYETGDGDYEVDYVPAKDLPDPDLVAENSDDYVTTEEELQQMDNTTTPEDNQKDVDVVPVYQEETTYTEDTASLPITTTETSNTTTNSTTESSNTDLESAVDQAIEVMASGNDASITYDVSTGQYSTEVTTTNPNIEEIGLTK